MDDVQAEAEGLRMINWRRKPVLATWIATACGYAWAVLSELPWREWWRVVRAGYVADLQQEATKILEAQPTDPNTFKFEGEYSLEKLVERAVRSAQPHCYGKLPRWVAVRDVFGWGSTTSAQLCRHFGLDPHEQIEGCFPNEEEQD
jgi:hypothetical protein